MHGQIHPHYNSVINSEVLIYLCGVYLRTLTVTLTTLYQMVQRYRKMGLKQHGKM
jgi:hypothetical protein